MKCWLVLLVCAGLFAGVLLFSAGHWGHAPAQEAVGQAPEKAQGPALLVQRPSSPLTIDGKLDEDDWNSRAARTGPFRDPLDREAARPYSEARLLWDDQYLYLALYAADEDIELAMPAENDPARILQMGIDAFVIVIKGATPLRPARLAVFSASGGAQLYKEKRGGRFAPMPTSGIRTGVDTDGTADNPNDTDEEWVIEAAIPWNLLAMPRKPGNRYAVAIERCDRVAGGSVRCGQWGMGKGRTEAIIQLAE